MDNLFGTVGKFDPSYLFATNPDHTDMIAVSLEPGHETVKRGTVLYRKEGSVIYAPAKKSDIVATNNLVVLCVDADTSKDSEYAIAVQACRKGNFIAGHVLDADGAPIDATCDVALRAQGITFTPMDDWSQESTDQEADNKAGE